jgi:hypothetical protein
MAALPLLVARVPARARKVTSLLRDSVPGSQTAETRAIFGVWWRGGPDPVTLKREAPFVKGVFAAFRWSELEPSNHNFNWAEFDETLTSYANAGLYIQFIIWVGPHSPRWIYSEGVPEVRTTPTRDPHGRLRIWTYPFYLDPNYKHLYCRMLGAVAAHIDTLPREVRNRVICIQTAEGTTGDEGGYKGEPLNPAYALSPERWDAFKFETWKLFASLYRPKRPVIHLLINSGNHGEYNEWLLNNIPDAWRKAGNPGHGYQLNDEKDTMAFFDPLINHPESGHLIRCRSEMDETFKGWFQEAPVWNMYWLNLWGLHFGIDIFQHETQPLRNQAFTEGFRFYARYGGQKDALTSPGAWCALRDGLDAADFNRFPAATFGSGSLRGSEAQRNAGLQRTLNIARAFARYGAAQGDPEHGMRLIMQNRDAARMNDVGWTIEAGNYQRYMRQWNPNGTSQGYWRQGPKDQPYGRFARGFDVDSGKDAMFFNIDDRFFQGKPPPGKRPARVRVIYLDEGTGSFALKYDATGNSEKIATTVKKTNSGDWKQITVPISDGNFGNRCPHGTDLMLVNTSKQNTLFHLIEIARE